MLLRSGEEVQPTGRCNEGLESRSHRKAMCRPHPSKPVCPGKRANESEGRAIAVSTSSRYKEVKHSRDKCLDQQ